ncbi:MAG: YlmH/Sll1252 family protein [Eubacteriaceae bacterium]|nr:YlmH/Sll1252 family protein [Eubacteriaceae bacterium]
MGQKDYLSNILEESSSIAVRDNKQVFLDFYEPSSQMVVEREIARYPESDCAFFGGHEYSQRKMLCIFPKGFEPEGSDYPLGCLHISGAPQAEHRDILGSLMALGIEREKTGDMDTIGGGTIQVFVSEPLPAFVAQNLEAVGANKVAVSLINLEDVVPSEPKLAEMEAVIASMRIDNIIHAAWRIPRAEAAAFVKADKVKINHASVTKPSVNVKEGDIVSVRSKGRLVVGAILATTKKGNIRLCIKKFI